MRPRSAALRARAENYLAGDTDLSWTRLTPWRALLAASLDQYPARIKAVLVEAERSNPSADLLAAWLLLRTRTALIVSWLLLAAYVVLPWWLELTPVNF